MQRTKITVGLTHTHNLGNYSNVRPSILIEVALDDGDDPEAVKAQLKAEVVAYIHEAIDEALEQEGQSAKFSPAPRFRLYYTSEVNVGDIYESHIVQPLEQLLVLVPDGVRLGQRSQGNRAWWNAHGPGKMRYKHALEVAAAFLAENDGYRLIETTGELATLPEWVREAPRKPEAYGPAPMVVFDLLRIAGETPPDLDTISTWSREQREAVVVYAGSIHLRANDNDVEIPPRPAVLDEYRPSF